MWYWNNSCYLFIKENFDNENALYLGDWLEFFFWNCKGFLFFGETTFIEDFQRSLKLLPLITGDALKADATINSSRVLQPAKIFSVSNAQRVIDHLLLLFMVEAFSQTVGEGEAFEEANDDDEEKESGGFVWMLLYCCCCCSSQSKFNFDETSAKSMEHK